MPKLSPELIQSHFREKEYEPYWSFGYWMNSKYKLNDIDLAQELDNNIAFLRLMKDHSKSIEDEDR